MKKSDNKKDILQDAIIQAKILKDVAVENAKSILMESITPKIESIISKKLKESMEDDESEMSDRAMNETDELEDENDEVKEEEKTVEDDDEDELFEGNDEDSSDEDEDIEIESILKELDSEASEDEKEKDNVKEQDESSDEDEDEDDELDIEEIILSSDESDEDEDNKDVSVNEIKKENVMLKKKLKKSNSTIKSLTEQINEINLLNHKLYHILKLFKKLNLSNESKIKIVETFDRATTIREVKLIYATLYESLKSNKAPIKSKKVGKTISEIKNSGASKSVGADLNLEKSSVIAEGNDLIARFQKLANIK